MDQTTDFVTTECPNGHRVRGDLGWLNREVTCPHCQAQFIFKRPDSQPATVVAVQRPNVTGPNQPKRSGDWASDTGVMRILGDYVPPPSTLGRRCGICGTTNPEGVSICENCDSKLPAEETSNAATASVQKVASDESPKPVHFREVDRLAFEDVAVRRVIRPRREIVFLDINESLEQMQRQVRDTMHSRYPVCDRSDRKSVV